MTPRPTTESELVDFVRSADVRAPEELHAKVDALIAAHPARVRRWPRLPAPRRAGLPGLAAAGALAAAVAVVLVVSLSGGGNAPLSVERASALTLRGATAPAPGESVGNHEQLAAAVDGIAFPYWQEHFGWRSTGARSDRLDGRTVTTVFYEDPQGRRIGYAIVAGMPAPRLNGGAVAWREGVPYHVLSEHGVQAVTWTRDGRLCVVSGRGVDSATLLQLASWA
ncbi:MAG TPA: hypothetical protein VMS02_04695 [Solirubrobacteraceae bacterium]|nr:hypothetical protein [Solirubrobacteraceae bacterium]